MPNTSASTTVQEHLRDLHSLLQDSLKQWNLATTKLTATAVAGQANPDLLPNELHPLGPIELGTLQREYKEKIAAIRAICLSFAQGPLHQSLNGGDSSLAPAFRKYSTLLKEETQLEEAMSSVKESMKQCQITLRAASQDGNIKTDHLLNTIKDMASGYGLECYLETGSRPNSLLPVSTLTIGGNVIVIDIDVESTGAVLRVKVSYDSEIHQDDRVDRLLAHNLRCKCAKLLQTAQSKEKPTEVKLVHMPNCSRDFDAFSKNLKALAMLDSLTKKYPHVDFFHNIRSIDADFKELFNREMLLSGGDLQRVFTQGHGIPFTHAVLPGPSVAYWACKGDLLDISWEAVQTAIDQGANEKLRIPFHRISVTMEESTPPSTGFLPDSRSGSLLRSEETQTLTSVPYGTIMNDQGSVSGNTILQQPLRWVVPTADSTVAATFVAVLHPPVVVSEQIAKQLAALSNQAGLNTTMGFHKDSGYLSLQELLIKQSIEQPQWEVVLDHGPDSVRQLYSFDRTKNEARLLHRIPFTHVSQIYICTKALRQQMVFNTLFQSCFKETTKANDSAKRFASLLPSEDSTKEVSIVIHTPQPPNGIMVSFMDPYVQNNMLMDIQIDASTAVPSVRLNMAPTHQSNGNSNSNITGAVFTLQDENLTKVLRLCDSIPILVRWVLKRSHAWSEEQLQQHQQQVKSQVHSMRRTSSYADDGGVLKRPRV
ncbi:hypothetical protein EMPS_01246 [Entomortierella parvispora]|uniref:Mediator of RNA polymerase II transcription subunit 1 n=1 Tax=Entomortierella parvispora TaxID=205924 RepID=A0A9P3H2M4_9FUNG|nr:hypothetical protein EMPS_01246 [Entomortierella parvispora]